MSGINGLLWVLSVVLAIILLVVGFVLVRDDAGGRKRLGWAETPPRALSRILGIVMLIGALCLVVAPLIAGLGWLAPAAAAVLAFTMLGIAQSYIAKRDTEGAGIYILLMLMLAALAYGRWSTLG